MHLILSAIILAGTSISGPTAINEHTLGKFSASVDSRSSVLWDVAPTEGLDIYEGNGVLIVTGRPGRYQITLTEIGPSGNADKPFNLTRVRSTLDIIQGNTPKPPAPPVPPPVPPAPPTPPLPLPDTFGLRAWAGKQLATMPVADRAQAPNVAGELRGLASALAAGGIKDPIELQRQTQAAVDRYGMGWLGFRQAVGVELRRLNFGDKGAADFSTAWNDIAGGLDGK